MLFWVSFLAHCSQLAGTVMMTVMEVCLKLVMPWICSCPPTSQSVLLRFFFLRILCFCSVANWKCQLFFLVIKCQDVALPGGHACHPVNQVERETIQQPNTCCYGQLVGEAGLIRSPQLPRNLFLKRRRDLPQRRKVDLSHFGATEARRLATNSI